MSKGDLFSCLGFPGKQMRSISVEEDTLSQKCSKCSRGRSTGVT